ATGRPVIAGPSEATAAGNVVVQAIGAGLLRDLGEARELIRRSFPPVRFEPNPQADWDAAYQRFCALRPRE
ncbi:MAG: rhamnulokinase, partial [Bryobacteraceae bacterium]